MKVNKKKTQILCIHANKSDVVTSYIRTEEGEITSGKTLKILGFHFDQNPNAVYYVTQIVGNMYKKLWMLRFLKKSGMSSQDLLKIYKSVIRAAAEYCSTVYHSLIPSYMAERLESVQRQAIRIIYGRRANYQNIIDSGELETLAARRVQTCLRFAQKAAVSEKFGRKWFPKRTVERETRETTRRIYDEKMHRTERDKNNPLQFMIRLLNENS